MSGVGILAYLGLAVVSIDPFGGIVAGAALARGAGRRALAALVLSYLLAITAAILALRPILGFLGHLLAPVLAAHIAWSIAQLVIALALLGIAAHQLRASLRPPKPREGPARVSPWALMGASLLLALTSMPDPPFIAAVGIAGHVEPRIEGVALLVAWNLIYQSPLLILATAGLVGAGAPAARAWERLSTRWGVPLQRTVAVLLAAAGIACGIDGILALDADAFPWLHLLMDA